MLGALEADRDGSMLRLAGGRQRTLLAVLAAAAGRVVTAEALTDALWGDDLPADPPAALFNQVSRLRRVLGAALRTEPGGYRLDVDADDVDAHAFERLLMAGRAAPDPAEAVALLERAVDSLARARLRRAERGRPAPGGGGPARRPAAGRRRGAGRGAAAVRTGRRGGVRRPGRRRR